MEGGYINYNLHSVEQDLIRFFNANSDLIKMDIEQKLMENLNDITFTFDGMTPCNIKQLEIK